jgi:hypothetical protein
MQAGAEANAGNAKRNMKIKTKNAFMRMVAFAVKFVPGTFFATVLKPAAIVCGRTALILGAPNGSTTGQPQRKLAPVAFEIFNAHL